MVKLKRIGVLSAGKTGFWVGFALTITQIIFFLLFITLVGRVNIGHLPPSLWVRMAISTFLSALGAGITWGAIAYIYNLVSGIHGGLELYFEPADTQEKRKNEDINA